MSQIKGSENLHTSLVLFSQNQILEEDIHEERIRNTKRRRRAIEEENEDNQISFDEHCNNGGSNDNFFSSSKPPLLMNLIQSLLLPWRMKKIIDEDMGGHDIKMIIEKKLCKSDLSPNNNRFSIPESKILKEAMDFLKPQEAEFLRKNSKINNKPQGINVLLLDPNLQEFDLVLKRWRMRTSTTYNLTHDWKNVVQRNNFKVDDTVQLWSFRTFDQQLRFALVKLN